VMAADGTGPTPEQPGTEKAASDFNV